MFWFGVPWLVIRGVLAGMEEEPRTCCAARFGLCDAEAGANDAGEDVAGLRVPLAERATGRKLCGAPDEAAEDDCVDRLAECEALERAGCEAGENSESMGSWISEGPGIYEVVVPSSSVLRTG